MKKVELNQTVFVTRIGNDNKDHQRKTLQEVSIEIDSENQEFTSIIHDNEELCMTLDNLKLFSAMINNAIHLFENYGNKPEKFARQCSITGEGMNEGWFINGKYFKYKKHADEEARTIPNEESSENANYKDFNELYNSFDDEESNDFAYYTSWEDQDDYQYQMIDGQLQEIEE